MLICCICNHNIVGSFVSCLFAWFLDLIFCEFVVFYFCFFFCVKFWLYEHEFVVHVSSRIKRNGCYLRNFFFYLVVAWMIMIYYYKIIIDCDMFCFVIDIIIIIYLSIQQQSVDTFFVITLSVCNCLKQLWCFHFLDFRNNCTKISRYEIHNTTLSKQKYQLLVCMYF